MLELRLENTMTTDHKLGNMLVESIVANRKGGPTVFGTTVFLTLMTAFEFAIRAAKHQGHEDLAEKLKFYSFHDIMPILFSTYTASMGQKALVVAADKRDFDHYRDTVVKRLTEEFDICRNDFSNYWVKNGELKIRSEKTGEFCTVLLMSTYFMCDEHRDLCESIGWTSG